MSDNDKISSMRHQVMQESKEYNLPPADTGLGYGPDRLATIIGQVLHVLESRLIGQEGNSDAVLTARDIQSALLPFKSWQDNELKSILYHGWDDVSKASEEAYWAKMRTHPLERLMVRNFAHLLAPYGESAVQGVTFSRRVIPAFSALLQQMMGPELINEYRKRAQEIIEQYLEKNGENIDWVVIYGMASAQAISNDILVYIAQYFTNMPQRRLWMIDFFNQNISRDGKKSDNEWKLDDVSAIQLINALYLGLFRELGTKKEKAALLTRYGQKNIDNLMRAKEAIAEDARAVLAGANT